MGQHDWYRNETWNDAIEAAFNTKLKRARHKSDYLRIQACMLTRSHPNVALKLLDRYFELGDVSDNAQAHCDRAEAFITLGRIDDAILSYTAALAHEAEYPNRLTNAKNDLRYLIATHGLDEKYKSTQKDITPIDSDDELLFPVQQFMLYVSRALIAKRNDEVDLASDYAQKALEAASQKESGFRYHKELGLVSSDYDKIVNILHSYLHT